MTANFLLDLLTALWLGMIGACVGSFLNVLAYRLPRGMSVVWRPSHCPHCQQPVRAQDNLPVVGWLRLRGRCRDCQAPIPPRYAIVELLVGTAFVVLAYVELFRGGANLPGGPISKATGAGSVVWDPQWPVVGLYAYHTLLVCLIVSVILLDLERTPVPRRLLLPALLVGCAAPYWGPQLHGAATFGLSSSLWGLATGMGLAAPWIFFPRRRPRTGPHPPQTGCLAHQPANLLAAAALGGAFLGSAAIFSIFALFLLAAGGGWLLRQPNLPRLAMPCFGLAVVLQICCGAQLTAWFTP